MLSSRNSLNLNTQVKSKRQRRIYHANMHQKKAGKAMLIKKKKSHFRTRNIFKDKQNHYTIITEVKSSGRHNNCKEF